MSSNIDQRTSTNHEQQGDKMIQPVDVAYSSYMPGNNMQVNTYEAVNSQHYRPNQYLNTQVGYSQANMSGSAPVNDPYAMSGYYQQYVQFPGAMVPGSGAGVWSSNPSGAMSYDGGYANEYMPYGSSAMPGGQYDYSAVSWFPTGLDYSGSAAGAAWAPKQPPSDYNSNGYYENATVMGGGGDVSYAPPTPWTGLDAGNLYSPMTGGEVEPNNGDIRALDQGFKTMFVSGGDNNGDYTSSTRRQGGGASSAAAAAGQKKSWANVASQPARAIKPSLAPPQLSTGRRSMGPGGPQTGGPGKYSAQSAWTPSNGGPNDNGGEDHQGRRETTVAIASKHVTPATGGAQYNPKDFDLTAKLARFFVIKSFSEDDIHRSIKFSIWCSTEYGNKRLDAAWHDREGKGPVYLLFSVNGSGHFCGMAQMTSAVDYHSSSTVWAQDKWKGMFNVRWIYVKDVPNSQLRHIRLENNEGKPVTNSRDTQEVVPEKGRQVLRIMAQYRHTTSIFDDFGHYEKQLEEGAGTTTSTTTPGATTAVNGNGANV